MNSATNKKADEFQKEYGGYINSTEFAQGAFYTDKNEKLLKAMAETYTNLELENMLKIGSNPISDGDINAAWDLKSRARLF